MACLRLFIFDNGGMLVGRERLPRNFNLWEGRLAALATCFTLNYFDAEVPAVAQGRAADIQNKGAVVHEQIALAAATARVRNLAQGEELWIACSPRIDAGWTTWSTGLLCPDAQWRASECTLDGCWEVMRDAIAWSQLSGCRLFVGPEYFFHNGKLAHPTPLTADEYDTLHTRLASATAADNLALVIPGTVFWTDRDGVTHNSLLAYTAGENLCTGDTFYDKQHWTGEEVRSAQRTLCGPRPYAMLSWQSLRICVQICQDCAFPLPGECDIHVVLGYNTNMTNPKNRAGGVFAYADAMGIGRTVDLFQTSRAAAGRTLHELRMAWTPRQPF